MKIIDAERKEYYIIETNEQWDNLYRRPVDGDSDSWEKMFGNSWELWDGEVGVEMEELLQKYLKQNPS